MPVGNYLIKKASAIIWHAVLTFCFLSSACSEQVSTPDTQESSAWIEAGRAALSQQRYADALDSFKRASISAPRLAGPHFERGNIYAQLGQAKEAVATYRQALALEPNHQEARHNLAVLRADQGHLPEAISLLETLANYAPALETLSLFYAKQGQYQAAEQALQNALQLAPEHASLYLNLGSLYMRQGRYQEAETALEQTWQLDSTQVEAARVLGLLYLQTRRNEQAISYFSKVIDKQSAHIEAHYNMATALSAAGRRSAAHHYMQRFEELSQRAARIAQLRRSLDETPDDISVRLELAHHYTLLEQIPRAITHYRAILLADSLHTESLVRLSSLLLRRGEWLESLVLCKRAIANSPPSTQLADLHFTAGYIELVQKNYATAEDHLTSALAIDPQRAEAWNNLGNLQQQRGDLSAAQHSFLQATQIDPRLADAHFNLAATYQQERRWPLAQNAFRASLAAYSSLVRAYYGLAGALEATDSTKSARLAYQQFIARWQGDARWLDHARQRLTQLAEAP